MVHSVAQEGSGVPTGGPATPVVDVWAEVRRLEGLAEAAKSHPLAFATTEGRVHFNYDAEEGIAAAQADLDSYAFKKSNWETNITVEGGPFGLMWGLIIGRRQLDINAARERLRTRTANSVGMSASECTQKDQPQ